MDKLYFVTAGQPICNGNAGYENSFKILEKLNLDGMELEFVHGVRMTDANQKLVKEISTAKNMALTAHGPYLSYRATDLFQAPCVLLQEQGISVPFHSVF